MGVINKRNAVLGWAAWQVGKGAMKRKARGAARVDDTKRPNKGAIAALIAAAGGALVFWRKRRNSEPE